MPAKLVDDPLVLFELVVFVTISRLQKIDAFNPISGISRGNVPVQTPSDYYKRAVAIPLLDHLKSEMKTYFNRTNDAVLSNLFNLLPELVAVGDRNPDIEAALEFYENDLPSLHVVDVELLRWKRKWCSMH